MEKDKQDIVADQIGIPENFKVKGGDGRAIASWNEVEGADGYVIFYYKVSEPDVCFKTRYSQNARKTILGFANGEEYLANVCAYTLLDGKEIRGSQSEKVSFMPISLKLKAQNTICLTKNESDQIRVEYRNRIPHVTFYSLDEDIAAVDEHGLVTAKREGVTEVVSTMDSGESVVTKIVCERDLTREKESGAVIMLMGDLMCAVNHQRMVRDKSFDFTYAFDHVKHMIRKADVSIGVLETMCNDNVPFECEELRLPSGSPNCNSPSTFIEALRDAGFDALVTANNHNCDTGTAGLEKTVSSIRRNGMKNIGTMEDNPVYFDANGIKVAVIAQCMINNGHESEMEIGEDGIGRYSAELFGKYVDEARMNGAEFIIAYQHWGKMNSAEVKPSQKKAAKEMAESGADLIVASHPHVMQCYEMIATSDGRQVPCAYSLGNFLTSMNEFVENRYSAILCCILHRCMEGEITSSVTFVPTVCVDHDTQGVKVHVAHGELSEKIGVILTKNAMLKHVCYEPRVLLQGSIVLKKVFARLPECQVNQDACIISQLSILNGEKKELAEKCAKRVSIDVEKSFEQHLVSEKSDYIVVDFYAAAAISVYKMENSYYTASETFKNTDFFKNHADKFERISPPFEEAFWKDAVKTYADVLLKHFPKERIVLIRLLFSDTCVILGEVRNGTNRNSLNKRISEMEQYFISIVNPIVIDVAKYYFADGRETSPSAFEEYFYLDVARKMKQVMFGSGHRFYYSEYDTELRMQRIIRYYDNLMARGYQKRMLDPGKAADQIMLYSSKPFILAHSQAIMELMRQDVKNLEEVAFYLEENELNQELVNAAEAILSIHQKDLSKSFDFYQVLFKWRMRILKDMASQLSEKVGFSICEAECEKVFLIRNDAQALSRYKADHPKVLVDIWGSCISREVMNRNKPKITVNKYIFKQPQLLAFEQPIDFAVPTDMKLFKDNSWRRRTIEEAFSHAGIDKLRRSDAEWIVIDFYDLICNAVVFQGQLWEVDDFVQSTEFYKSVSNECSKNTFFFECYDMDFSYKQMKKFTDFLIEKYGDNMVLIKADLKDTYIDLDFRLKKIKGDAEEFQRKRHAIARYEKMFEELTNCYVIDMSKYYYASDSFPLGGAHIVHYEDDFYNQACDAFTAILKKPDQKYFDKVDEDYLLMRELKLNRA